MIDVPIAMNKPIESGSEIYACVIQLGSDSFSQSIKCNIAYASPTASGEPQRINLISNSKYMNPLIEWGQWDVKQI
jgi:hypothetical protein